MYISDCVSKMHFLHSCKYFISLSIEYQHKYAYTPINDLIGV